MAHYYGLACEGCDVTQNRLTRKYFGGGGELFLIEKNMFLIVSCYEDDFNDNFYVYMEQKLSKFFAFLMQLCPVLDALPPSPYPPHSSVITGRRKAPFKHSLIMYRR
jgi:hypothetical protein